MSSLVHSPGLSGYFIEPSEASSEAQVEPFSFFRSIPPERTGLNGEYDHYGLAKRVDRALREKFPPQSIEKLNVAQRGRVVVLAGRVPNSQILRQLIDAAANVSGATYVETLAVKLDQ